MLATLDALGLERVKLVGHDWGGWVGFLICLRAPERVDRYLALNIVPPFVRPNLASTRAAIRFYYQWLLASPFIGRRLAARLGRMPERMYERNGMGRGIWTLEERSIFLDYLAEPEHAWASVQYYRTFQLREAFPLLRGRYRKARLQDPHAPRLRQGRLRHRLAAHARTRAPGRRPQGRAGRGLWPLHRRRAPGAGGTRALEFLA